MKTLYLVRHAKSSWKDVDLDDFERPLNKRGKRDAPFMGNKLKKMGIKPDKIISSPAVRAKATAEFFAKAFGIKSIAYEPTIYDADTKDLLSILNALDDDLDTVMIFGHNPEFTWLANKLGNISIENIPTAGIVCLSFGTDRWKGVAYGKGRQLFFMYPKQFKQ